MHSSFARKRGLVRAQLAPIDTFPALKNPRNRKATGIFFDLCFSQILAMLKE